MSESGTDQSPKTQPLFSGRPPRPPKITARGLEDQPRGKPDRLLLKPRLARYIGMILGGVFLSWIGLRPLLALGLYKEPAALIVGGSLGALGLFWVYAGAKWLASRDHLKIAIDDAGIRIPTGNVFRLGTGFISRARITLITKHESLKGRRIEGRLENGYKMFIRARHYCELDRFLSYCRTHGMPVV
jgi:hypothetical protein